MLPVNERGFATMCSEEEATQVLVDFLGKAWLGQTWLGWGLEATKIDPRRSSARDAAPPGPGGEWPPAPLPTDHTAASRRRR